MNTFSLKDISETGNFDFLGFTGSFLKTFCEKFYGLTFSDTLKDSSPEIFRAQSRVSEFFEESEALFYPLCRKSAFLRPEFLFFADPLLKKGFSIFPVSDEDFALGLAAVQDFCLHSSERMLLAGAIPDPVSVSRMISPCRSEWLGWGEAPTAFPSETQDRAFWINLSEKSFFSSRGFLTRSETSSLAVKSEAFIFGKRLSLPEEEERGLSLVRFECAKIVENLRARVHEVQERGKALKKGLFGKSCGSSRLINRLSSPQECEKVEKLFSTAYQSFRWIHEFEVSLTPEHLELLRAYASLGASSLCVLRTYSQEQTRMDYPDSELLQDASEILRSVSEKAGDIPHIHLESRVSPTMIQKNFKTLNTLNQKDSASRLRSKIRALLRELGTGERSGREIWKEIVKISTDLGLRFGESHDSAFFLDSLEPYADEMPEFVSETEAKRFLEQMDADEKKSFQPEDFQWVVSSSFFLKIIQTLEEREAGNAAALEAGLSENFHHGEAGNPERSDSLSKLSPMAREDILRVRKEFQGTQIVLIGGNPNPEIKARLENLFNAEFIWEDCGHHFAMSRYDAWINSSRVSCFIVRKSKCSHFQYLELVRAFQSAGKKCVRLRNEISPSVIAAKIVKQCLSENH
ncbi:MAG: hypothetical protein E7028_05745 [Planctomycetaceae bacterium]|nr:hypothetical protein [Planctomycetaceae bacterium]